MTAEFTGWLLDIYPHQTKGVTAWFIEEGAEARRCLQMDLTITLYGAGPHRRLRELWRFLRDRRQQAVLSRQTKQELFKGEFDVLGIEVEPRQVPVVARLISKAFADLSFYNVDVSPPLHFAAATGVKPLGKCYVQYTDEQLIAIEPIESADLLEPDIPDLRVLTLEPDCDPDHREPTWLKIGAGRKPFDVKLASLKHVVTHLRANISHYDPDVILTRYGDSWLLPKLLKYLDETGGKLMFNRDPNRPVQCRPGISYTTYGQTLYQAQRSYFFGRWHIDRQNALQYGELGIWGITWSRRT